MATKGFKFLVAGTIHDHRSSDVFLAVSLNQESKRVAHYMRALALFNLHQIGDAESRAIEAEHLDRDHKIPPIRLLLAQIDEVKGDWPAAVTQLRDCLKYANNSLSGKLAKQELARLEGGPI